MASLKELKNRIASVKATQKITKAMQMVAAAKLRRAQEAAVAARPYARRLGAVVANLAGAMAGRDDAPRLLAGTGRDDVHLLVVCTAERGLCGGFNSSIVRLAREHAASLLAAGKTVKILTVGKKGADALKREHGDRFIDRVELRGVKSVSFDIADDLGRRIVDLFEAGEFDVCTLFYSEFKSVIQQIPTAKQLLPVKVEKSATVSEANYEFEPDEAEILETLLPRYVSVTLFSALLENAAGEMGAKMSAMDNATRNAGEMIDRLSITYNRTRQAKITTELVEIISGAEAL
ncbi:F0F1 ATP synthase subunit gamma [Pleomorphomonas diazotrophica]|uniref:ATP synthase gamma chain n=1 Tax=Pleomorphomonas diazotrophica TaxID=1166257 RepID=A0A1I4RNF4_9HYPH|nr:F0F1 ATP synthase subunit gamma [Pleomorphomonas diazotrophica]PKR88165.1 F0F1 ATP synthase subunit gamma [Pleomorphomonas diazotrophica]SFM53666.1 ATP synthase F1 subcomplex gamma subunit [Pleomorphomonas diazotrophica]